LGRVEAKYGVSLPRKVVAVDFGSRGDLYVRFKHSARPVGEATADGLAVFFYEDDTGVVGLELLELVSFTHD
jgi:hypothetical protein